MESLYIVMPAYNEEANMNSVIDAWYPIISDKGKNSRLVINCSGSRDGTSEIIRSRMEELERLELLEDSKNTYGDKVLDLYRLAVDRAPDFVFQTDSDGQTDPNDFLFFWKNRHNFDVQIGNRYVRGDGIVRKAVQYVECSMLALFFKVKVPDANTPFRLMRTEVLKKYLSVIPANYSMPNMILTAFFTAGDEKISFPKVRFGARQGGKNTMNLKKIFVCGVESLRVFFLASRSFINRK